MKKKRRNGIKHLLAVALFCMVMSVGMICLADEKGTVIAESAKIRASADTSSKQLGSVAKGGTVDVISKTTGADGKEWYQVYVDANTKGYIRGDLVKLRDGAVVRTSQDTGAAASNTDAAPTAATSVEARKGTVVTNNVRIRKGASTNHDVVATANRGMLVTVTGEADGADGKKWYQISFTYNNNEITGFIRSDLVTFDNVPADAASSEITGEENPGEEQPGENAPEETQPPEQPEEPGQSGNNNVIPMSVEEVPYIMPGFEPLVLKSNGQEYNGYVNGKFFIFYAQRNGEAGWYLFDSERGEYQRYAYTTPGVVVPDDGGSVGMALVIVLVVIIIILVAAVGLLLLKLREHGSSYRGYDDEDEEDRDDDIEDLEDLEDEEELRPVRRPQGGTPQGQPVRRPQGGTPQGQPVRRPQGGAPQGQPVRRPQGGAPQGQPVRRPQGGTPTGSNASVSNGMNGANGSGGANARPQGQQGQPVRRPQGGTPQGQPPRRPQGQPPRRPQPQNEKGQPQKGYKAKNLLEDDDMDIMDL